DRHVVIDLVGLLLIDLRFRRPRLVLGRTLLPVSTGNFLIWESSGCLPACGLHSYADGIRDRLQCAAFRSHPSHDLGLLLAREVTAMQILGDDVGQRIKAAWIIVLIDLAPFGIDAEIHAGPVPIAAVEDLALEEDDVITLAMLLDVG